MLLEDRRLPVVVAAVDVADVILREPAEKAGVASLTGSLLEEGTDKHTGKQIAALIEDTGGNLDLGASGGTLKVLTPDTDLGLSLLFECLMRPAFPADEFDRMKDQQLAGIDEAQTQPQARASEAFHAIVYGKHPFGRPGDGTRATVEKLTAADCKAFHQARIRPELHHRGRGRRLQDRRDGEEDRSTHEGLEEVGRGQANCPGAAQRDGRDENASSATPKPRRFTFSLGSSASRATTRITTSCW